MTTPQADDQADDAGWVSNDPGLICMVGDTPECGRACLPLSEYAPLVERIADLEAIVGKLRERLAHIAAVAGWGDAPG
jgi:hypothetical protein